MVAEVVQAAYGCGHSRPVCGTFIGAVFDDSARLRLLHQLGCAFAARTELEDLCRLVISKCGEVLQAEGVGILLQDPGAQELFFPYVANEDPVAAERLRGLRFPADRGIAGEVLRCGRPIRVDDVRSDRRFYSGIDEQSGARTRNLIATPLRTEQGVIGVLQAVNRRGPNGFSDDDLAFLEALSGSVAIAIDNARAMEERAALRALRREIEIASEIQQSILPRRFPAFPDRLDFDLHAAMLPAHDVGGDFYDFFLIDSTHLGVVIADVSGKGMPAAIFMAVSRTLLKATALSGIAPAACLQQVNRLLHAENDSEMFVSLFYGILDLHGGRVTYSNGGHNPPLLRSAASGVRRLAAGQGCVLGVFEEAAYEGMTCAIVPGDTLLLYTDGVTEAMNPSGELYGEERLYSVARNDHGSPRALIDALIADVRRHGATATQSDDITLLAVTYRG
jgi:serine phosphatase RsbU (regulator of sigma subunit)